MGKNNEFSSSRIIKVAILVDGGFYRKRAKVWKNIIKKDDGTLEKIPKTGEERAIELAQYCMAHIGLCSKHEKCETVLYRVFYYDCSPINVTVYHPFLKKNIRFGNNASAKWTESFFKKLKQQRKFALRLGKLTTQNEFSILPTPMKNLLDGKIKLDELTENDFRLNLEQKGVDMRIGIDIASLAYKKLVDQIILISGDSDFVPSAKLARREGIDFILDPMFMSVSDDLLEHIDGLRTPGGKFIRSDVEK